ncbi:MAG: hypothetical protein J5562_02130 [Clostridia bacterium]|nr:hypothetical protein [Clostridia bacterium]
MPFTQFYTDESLLNYDVFPKVLVKNKKAKITVRPLGARPVFEKGKTYKMLVCALEQGKPYDYPASGDFKELSLTCNDEGGFAFEHTFTSEQMYFLRFLNDEGRRIVQFPVYCVDEDLNGRYPLRGDLHMHTIRSDGSQCPAVVCANYRKHGLDFMVVSDHNRYYPSLEAIEFYKNVPNGLTIVPGEEVHMPPVHGQESDFHTVNFGGEYSINALTDGPQTEEKGTDKKYRSLYGECPDFIPLAEWEDKMEALAKEYTDLPADLDPVPVAVFKWIYDEIRKANGLGIFPHPTWISDVYHVPTAFWNYVTEKGWFDAFEVLGGENYYEQNGLQTLKYYDDRANGMNYPVVGSTDSHSSNPQNRNAFICSTMVFSPENERKALISSIKQRYSVAIDTIDENFRLVGDLRLCKYTTFLLKYYFPLHDDLCREEGRLMKQYATGTAAEKEEALKVLAIIGDRVQKHREKYFDF